MITDDQLKRILDDILRDVVCDCGNYRHHGVDWMPEGSGEGLTAAVKQATQVYRVSRQVLVLIF